MNIIKLMMIVLVSSTAFAGCFDSWSFSSHSGCSTSTPSGTVIEANVTDSGVEMVKGRAHRVINHVVNASDTVGGGIDVCTAVGDITVTTSDDEFARVTFVIDSDDADDARAARFEGVFTRQNDGLRIAAWQPASDDEGGSSWGGRHTSASVFIALPETGPYALKIRTDVGDITLKDLIAGEIDTSTDVGDITFSRVHATKDVDARSDVGDLDLRFASAQSAGFSLRSDVGDIDVVLAARADTGYDVYAESDVGKVHVDIGPAESKSASSDPPGERVETRSTSFDDRPTKIRIDSRSDVGDIDIKVQ